jgi:hypothetical protein
MASFATDSIIIIHTKTRNNYKNWWYSYKTTHAKKVELEYLTEFRLCVQVVWYSNCTFPTSWTAILASSGAVYMLDGGWNKSL